VILWRGGGFVKCVGAMPFSQVVAHAEHGLIKKRSDGLRACGGGKKTLFFCIFHLNIGKRCDV
jgi:hypothetical protein